MSIPTTRWIPPELECLMVQEPLGQTPEETIVLRFNRCINERDLDGLASLMAEGHTFVDSADRQLVGKAACLEAWADFFRQFPDYHNIFEETRTQDACVAIRGHAECSDGRLNGPTLWQARLTGSGMIEEWRVFEDTPTNRLGIGLGDTLKTES